MSKYKEAMPSRISVNVNKKEGVYQSFEPYDPLPLVFDSPHSGRIYPEDFYHICDDLDLRRAEDLYVDEFFNSAPNAGACYLEAHFPRSYIDVNRSLEDIDPLLLEEKWPGHTFTTPRAHAGIGLIRRLLKADYPVYDRKLTLEETRHRIETYYAPYHDKLKAIIDTLHDTYGQIWHINCHSMPSNGYKGRNGQFTSPLADFVIGDLDGTSCAREFSFTIRDCLKSMGYKVAMNDPYKGVEILQRYGLPHLNRHSLQIEINKALYIDEDRLEKTPEYNRLKMDIMKLIHHIADFVRSRQVPLAAD